MTLFFFFILVVYIDLKLFRWDILLLAQCKLVRASPDNICLQVLRTSFLDFLHLANIALISFFKLVDQAPAQALHDFLLFLSAAVFGRAGLVLFTIVLLGWPVGHILILLLTVVIKRHHWLVSISFNIFSLVLVLAALLDFGLNIGLPRELSRVSLFFHKLKRVPVRNHSLPFAKITIFKELIGFF